MGISERRIYEDEEERKQLSTHVSMLATYLLADGNHQLALPAYVAMMNELSRVQPYFFLRKLFIICGKVVTLHHMNEYWAKASSVAKVLNRR